MSRTNTADGSSTAYPTQSPLASQAPKFTIENVLSANGANSSNQIEALSLQTLQSIRNDLQMQLAGVVEPASADAKHLTELLGLTDALIATTNAKPGVSLDSLAAHSRAELEFLQKLRSMVTSPSTVAQQLDLAIDKTTNQQSLINRISNQISAGVLSWDTSEPLATRGAVNKLTADISELMLELGGPQTTLPNSLKTLLDDLNKSTRQFNVANDLAGGNSKEIAQALSQLKIALAGHLNHYLKTTGVPASDARVLANNTAIGLQNLYDQSAAIAPADLIKAFEKSIHANGLNGLEPEALQAQVKSLEMLIQQADTRIKAASSNKGEQDAWLYTKQTLQSRKLVTEAALNALNTGSRQLEVGMQYHDKLLLINSSFGTAMATQLRNEITREGGLNSQLEAARNQGKQTLVDSLQKQINAVTKAADQHEHQSKVMLKLREDLLRIYQQMINQVANSWTSTLRA